jgi:DNA-binding NtrC family response regulator
VKARTHRRVSLHLRTAKELPDGPAFRARSLGFVMASSGVMIGRAREVQVLYQLLSGVAAGLGAAVLVEGEAGIGKTWLMQSLTATARRRGLRVLVGAAHPFETTRPFGALSQALELRRGSSDRR